MQNISAVKEFLSKPKKIFITTHQKPDADALGSSLGLTRYLKKKGHHVSVVTPTDYPSFLRWMKGNEDILIFTESKEKSLQELEQADLIFCLDFSSLKRANQLSEPLKNAPAKKIMIDHHLSPEDFSDFSYWNIDAAATAELVHKFIVDLGDEHLIDEHIAESLYAGIMTDTGSFKHSNTTINVFNVCADLIEKGADISKVSKLIYDTNSIDKIKFLGFALSEKLKIFPQYNAAYFAISADELKKFNSQTGDTEGLVNFALSIDNIDFAAIIIERNEAIKMSFRSSGDFSANEFARKNFEGGGHKNAAGGISHDTFEKTIKKFETLLKKRYEL